MCHRGLWVGKKLYMLPVKENEILAFILFSDEVQTTGRCPQSWLVQNRKFPQTPTAMTWVLSGGFPHEASWVWFWRGRLQQRAASRERFNSQDEENETEPTAVSRADRYFAERQTLSLEISGKNTQLVEAAESISGFKDFTVHLWLQMNDVGKMSLYVASATSQSELHSEGIQTERSRCFPNQSHAWHRRGVRLLTCMAQERGKVITSVWESSQIHSRVLSRSLCRVLIIEPLSLALSNVI